MKSLHKEVTAALRTVLTPREEYVLRSRLGVAYKPQPFRVIGETLHISKGRVRQIEMAALRKLRDGGRAGDAA